MAKMVEVASETLMLRLPLHVVLAMHSSKHGQSLQKAHYPVPVASYVQTYHRLPYVSLRGEICTVCEAEPPLLSFTAAFRHCY